MTRTGRAFLGVVAVVVVAQLIPISKTNPSVTSDLEAPLQVKGVLRRSCYDCHSNETRWPWYSRVAPLSWGVAGHVHQARDELNFSEWGDIPKDKRPRALRKVWKAVDAGDMPLSSYLLFHPDARLSDDDKKTLREWTHAEP